MNRGQIFVLLVFLGIAALITAVATSTSRELLFFLGMSALSFSSNVGLKLESGPSYNLPARPILFKVLSGLAGLCVIAFFIFGFFAFSWWLPLVAFVVAGLSAGALSFLAFRFDIAVPAVTLGTLVGIGVALVVVFSRSAA